MKFYETLSESSLDLIHDAACRMLEEMGMEIKLREAREVLISAGAKQTGDEVIRIPRELVEQSIKSAPAAFRVYDRRGGSLEIGGESHHHLNGATMTEILEYPGWTRRPATLQDVRQLVHIIDALDAIEMAAPIVEGMDAPAGMGEIMNCAEMLKHTSKFCWACPVEGFAYEAYIEMAKALAGVDDLSQRPIVGILATMIPGFKIAPEAAHALLIAGREGIPVILMGGGANGVQSPATIAGTLVGKIAEELAGLCIVQSIRPGLPCIMDSSQMKLDMRTAELDAAGPESPISFMATAQLARKYGIPSYACPGADSKIGDFEAGYEMTQGLLTAILSGISVTVNAGTASKGTAASYELLVLHNEILRNLLRVRQGVIVNEDTLAVAVQKEVGFVSEYLDHPHTLAHYRSDDEMMYKDLFDATGIRAEYEDPCLRAHQRWQHILQDHTVAVSDEEKRAVDAVVAKYAGA